MSDKPTTFVNPQELKSLSLDELQKLADQVRCFLIDSVSKTGGHIGANLGTVELTLALHYVFDSPRDKLIWDTGHQGYTHKLVSGRADRFPSLNTYGGMNRFVSRTESPHDIIEASHAGTSLSVGMGLALANRLQKKEDYVIPIIGDGALCEGMALEALNHLGAERDLKLIVVLNDNGFAISPGYGALHDYLQTREVNGSTPETLFSSLGFEYLGPVDGHHLGQLIDALQGARESKKIPLIHAKTIKGHGLEAADDHPYRMHFSFPFDPSTGKGREDGPPVGYQDVASSVILEAMTEDEKIVAITPSTLYATGLQPVFDRFADRCFDPGMEEQHAMTLAVGMALEGFKPVVFYQSTFMQRAFDQIIHDVCFTNLPILLMTVRTGFSGYDNPTHHGVYEFSYLRSVPNLKMQYPKDRFELERMVGRALARLSGPVLIQMPYGPVDEYDAAVLEESDSSFEQAEVVCPGSDLLVITVGHKFGPSRESVRQLRRWGIDAGLVNLRYLKPLPETQLLELMQDVPRIVTVEEGVLEGGVGSAILALAADNGLTPEFLRIGLPCTFVEPGSNAELSALYGLDANGITGRIQRRWSTLWKQQAAG